MKSTRRFLMLTGLSPLFTRPILKAQGERYFTDGLMNGRGWVGSPRTMHMYYLNGARDIITAAPSNATLLMEPGNHMNTAEFCDAIDRFYADPANLILPVTVAMALVKLRVNGTDPAELEKTTAAMRRTATGNGR